MYCLLARNGVTGGIVHERRVRKRTKWFPWLLTGFRENLRRGLWLSNRKPCIVVYQLLQQRLNVTLWMWNRFDAVVVSFGCSTLCRFRVAFAAGNARQDAAGHLFIGPHPSAYCTYGRHTKKFMLRVSKPVCVQRKCALGVFIDGCSWTWNDTEWLRCRLKVRKLPKRCRAVLRLRLDSLTVAFWPTNDVMAAKTLNKQRPAMPVIVNKKCLLVVLMSPPFYGHLLTTFYRHIKIRRKSPVALCSTSQCRLVCWPRPSFSDLIAYTSP